MIQCSSKRFPPGHSDHIFDVIEFNLTGIGKCKIQVFPYQDDTNPPTVFITNENGIICGIRLDAPLFWGREYKLTDVQKKEINDIVRTMVDVPGYPQCMVWWTMKGMWSGLNDRLEIVPLPEDPPDYTLLQ